MSEIPEGYRILVAIILSIVVAFALFGGLRGAFEFIGDFISNIRPK